MIDKQFLVQASEFDLKYECSIADLSKVEKTKEDFWNEKEECYDYREYVHYLHENGAFLTSKEVGELLNNFVKENNELKQQIDDMLRFEHTAEHVRLSINIETGELQRHICATGQWFGDFDRILCQNWISKENYQKFIDRIIEVYNNEFKGDLND